jgi:hypothetical protein
MRKNVFLLAVCLVASVCLAGCFKVKQDFTVNPDGSGKVVCEISIAGGPQAAADLPALQEEARKEAARIISETQGVTAWKDVTFSGEKDGRINFKGTAYFKDITKFTTSDQKVTIGWKPAADGTVQLELLLKLEGGPAPKEPPKLTEEQIKKNVADAKTEMAQQLPMLAQTLNEARMEWQFTLPGTAANSVNFQPVADKPNTLNLVFEGKKMVEYLKTLSEDEAYMRANIVAGKDPTGPPPPEVFNEKIFGTNGRLTVTFKPGDKPLFDFAAESEAAKKAMPIPGLEAPAPATTTK